ncbi:tetratricopeptide repeat protein [Chthonomonas calidirosea]|uniref:tetratricopeptide repeat protein n=1 Tax=Chthonomonas calidirosea TaxID=454171 RepID=UPI0006EC5432|nr:tetratricopeptide repeat protein [Chthonomonas calidirosea]CEK19348.1 TPR repeat [Chthonomonas calidirosea]
MDTPEERKTETPSEPDSSIPTQQEPTDTAKGGVLANIGEDPSIPPGEAGIRHLLVRANLHRLRKQYAEAVECCIAAIRRRPDCQAAHSMLGDIYRDQENWAEAVRWYRMAVEIRPSAVDEARLQRAEQELLRRQQALPYAIPSDPELRAGTMPLMGLPPQRWLLGLWLVSLGFLAGVLLMLIAMRTHSSPPISPSSYAAPKTSGGFGNGVASLPPTYTTSPYIPISAPSSLQSPAASQAPPTSSSAVSAAKNDRTAPASSSPLPPSLPSAPVKGTAPLSVQPTQLAHVPDEPQTTLPQTSAPSPDPSGLTNGFQLTSENNLGRGEVAVFLLAPASYATDTSSTAQANIIRNIYRAARFVFANSYYASATVFVQVPSPQAGAPLAIAQANLLRTDAMSMNPDNASLQDLTAHLQNFQYFGNGSPPPNASSSTSSGGT